MAVTRSRVADQIIAELRHEIATGVYPRGGRLPPEKELAERFGVSAPTVREAIRALSNMGLLDVRHGSGTYVVDHFDHVIAGALGTLAQVEGVTLEQIIGLLEVLNRYAVDVAVDRATDGDLEAIRASATATAEVTTVDEVAKAVTAFLVSIALLTHDMLLVSLIRFLVQLLVQLEVTNYRPDSDEFWSEWAADTAPLRLALVDALATRERDEVHAAIDEFHRGVRQRLASIPALRQARLTDPEAAAVIRQIAQRTP